MPEVATPKSVLITGGSSGIGEALARAYIARGDLVFICGQNQERMEALVAELGENLKAAKVDVTDQAAVSDWIKSCAPLDLVIANAGIAGENPEISREQLDKVFFVNVDGVFNTVFPAIDMMRERAKGQIAVVSSIAGFRGMPSAAPYSASKAAVRVWCEGMRHELAAENIQLNVICPGFVRSRITDKNAFPMPFFLEGEAAARRIIKGLEKNKGRIVFPWPMYLGVWWLYAMPTWLIDLVTGFGAKRFRKS